MGSVSKATRTSIKSFENSSGKASYLECSEGGQKRGKGRHIKDSSQKLHFPCLQGISCDRLAWSLTFFKGISTMDPYFEGGYSGVRMG